MPRAKARKATIRTRGPQVADFFAHCYRHTKGPAAGRQFSFEPFEREFVDEFYRVDEQGRRLYRLGILGLPRGNGKSPLAAGLGLFEIVSRKDSPDVFCVAGSRDQARVVIDFARAFVDGGPLRARCDSHRSAVIHRPTNGVMRVLSSEGSLQHGLSPAATIADELHAFETQPQEELWTAMLTALHKRVDPFALGITTAGWDRQTLLGRIYDEALNLPDLQQRGPCLTIGRDLENGTLFWWYGAPDDCDIEDEAIWRACNPASWIELRDLRRQLNAPGFDELDFRRLHLNQWTRAKDSWIEPARWAALRQDGLQVPRDADVYAFVDAALYHDSTACAWAWRLEDGRIGIKVHVWTAREEIPHHVYVPGGKIRMSLVEDFIGGTLGRRYRVRETGGDPRYFDRSMEILEDAGHETVEFVQASGTMANAYQSFYSAVAEGGIVHDGDPVFAAHVAAAAAEKTERGWKLRKLRGHFDALVAAVMAHARCEAGGSSTSVYENRELLILGDDEDDEDDDD